MARKIALLVSTSIAFGHAHDCTSGVAGSLVMQAPACFEACLPQSCPGLSSTVQTFFTTHDVESTRDVLCAHKEQIRCLVDPSRHSACSDVFGSVKQSGYPLPVTPEELDSHCAAKASPFLRGAVSSELLSENEIGVPEAEALQAMSDIKLNSMYGGDKCMRGYLGMLSAMAPRCLQPCKPFICDTMNGVIKSYMKHKSVTDAKRAVCSNQQAFGCLLEPQNIGRCRMIFTQARRFGMALPTDKAGMKKECDALNR